MALLHTLSRLLVGEDAGGANDVGAALVRSYVDCVRRAGQMVRHAEMAPQSAAAQVLQRLAAEDEEQGVRLRHAIEIAGASVPTMAADAAQREGLNHWARLVADLDAHRRSVMESRELALHFAARLPQTAALFESLCRVEAGHCEQLRALIARADPQALD